MATQSYPPSDKQLSYRAELIDQAVNKLAGAIGVKLDPRAVVNAALAISLPAPTSNREASEQIEALKGGVLGTYARSRADWAQPIIDKVASHIGNDGTGTATVTDADYRQVGPIYGLTYDEQTMAPNDYVRSVIAAMQAAGNRRPIAFDGQMMTAREYVEGLLA